MAGPRNTSANKAYVVVNFPEDFSGFIGKLNAALDEESLSIAQDIVTDMKASTAYKDKTGILRKRMRAQKSHYVGGGAIAIASAPHAPRVEYGHALVIGGKVVRTIPAHPFMRPAKEKRINEAIERIGQRLAKELAE